MGAGLGVDDHIATAAQDAPMHHTRSVRRRVTRRDNR